MLPVTLHKLTSKYGALSQAEMCRRTPSVEPPILFSAQSQPSSLENRYSSHISSSFMNSDNNQELKIN